MSKIETNTIDTVSGTTNLTIGSTNSSTVTFENGAVTGHNYPAFLAYLSAFQGIANNTYAKVQFNTEVFDTDNAYDNSTNYRFTVPSGKAGKYIVHSQCIGRSNSGNSLQNSYLAIYVNGSAVNTHHKSVEIYSTNNVRRSLQSVNTILDLSASDYVEIYMKVGDDNHNIAGSGILANDADGSSFFHVHRIGA